MKDDGLENAVRRALERTEPAFWAFCALILVNLASRGFMCQTTIWDAIEDAGLHTDGREMARGRAS